MPDSLSVAIASQNNLEDDTYKLDKHLTPKDVEYPVVKPGPKWKDYYSNFMMVWAVVSHVSLLLQSIKIYDGKDASGVSLETYILMMVSSTIWLIYGFLVLNPRNWVIVMSSLTAISIHISIIIGIIKYGDGKMKLEDSLAE